MCGTTLLTRYYVHNVVVKTLQSALFPQGIGSGKSSLSDQQSFHNSGGVGAQTTLGNSNPELQLGCSTVSTGLGMIMYAFSFLIGHTTHKGKVKRAFDK